MSTPSDTSAAAPATQRQAESRTSGFLLSKLGLSHIREGNASKWITISLCCTAMFLDNMSVSGLVFAQQGIAEIFNATDGESGWTLSAYNLTFGSFLLLMGRAGDIFGHKQIFVSGILMFTICCLLAATITSSLIGLIVIRALQGLAAGATIPTAYALVATTVEGRAREMAVAAVGACQCLGVVVGTIVGGVFVTTPVNYRGVFWLSFGMAAICTVLGFLFIRPSQSRLSAWSSLDYFGAVIITCAGLLLVFGFAEGESGWKQSKVIAPIVLGGLLLLFFGFYEEWVLPRFFKSVEPLVPRRVWGYRNFVPILVVTALYNACFFSFQLNGAQFLVKVQGWSTIIASLMFLPIAGGAILCMPVLGPFYNHRFFPPKWVIAIGQAILVAGIVLFTRNGLHNGYWHWTFPSFIIIPLGTSSFFVNFLNIVFSSAPPEEQGLISGIAQTVAQVCTALGFSIASSFITADTPEALLGQYVNSFYFSLALAATGCVVSVVFVRSIPPRVKEVNDTEKASEKESEMGSGEHSRPGST